MAAEASATDDSGAALARYYDLDTAGETVDVETYLALAAATDEPILELAAGTGRVAIPLAVAGHQVIGVDRDADALDLARSRWERRDPAGSGGALELVQADITDVTLGRRFGLVILALNTFVLLDGREAQRRALATVANHLSDEGRAVIDVWLPAPDDLALYDGRVVLDWVVRDEQADEWVSKSTAARYAPAHNTATITAFFDAWRGAEPARRTHRTDAVSFVSVSELLAMVGEAGLDPVIVAGDYDMSELTEVSDRVILVCQRRRV